MQRCRWSPMPIFRACATCENSDRYVPPKKVDKNNILSREITRFLYFTTISLSTCAKSVSDKSHKQESVDAHWCDCCAWHFTCHGVLSRYGMNEAKLRNQREPCAKNTSGRDYRLDPPQRQQLLFIFWIPISLIYYLAAFNKGWKVTIHLCHDTFKTSALLSLGIRLIEGRRAVTKFVTSQILNK